MNFLKFYLKSERFGMALERPPRVSRIATVDEQDEDADLA